MLNNKGGYPQVAFRHDALGDEISKYAQATRVSKNFVLNIVTRVQDFAQQGSRQAIAQADRVESLLA
jgi:hypothetical protein